MLADTNTSNAVAGFILIAFFFLVVAVVVIALIKATGRASRAEAERDHLRRENVQLRQQLSASAPPTTYPPPAQPWMSPQGGWPPPGSA